MKEYVMISNYMNDKKYRLSFNKLALNTFGIDFEEWYNKKLFYNKYICYSYIYKEEIIANVSINKMDLIIDGEKKKAIQLGTVMTHKDYRNQGLAASLINHILQKYESKYDIIYLFANDKVLNFYPKFGFEKVIENKYKMEVDQIEKKATLIKKLNIDSEKHYRILERLVSNRQPVSKQVGIYNDMWPLLIYCLYDFKENLYYMLEEDIIVIIRRNKEILHIYDVISSTPIDLDSVIEKISTFQDEFIEFHFVPDSNKYKIDKIAIKRIDDTLFMKCNNKYSKKLLFPITSHT